jgi:hypothetical protein
VGFPFLADEAEIEKCGDRPCGLRGLPFIHLHSFRWAGGAARGVVGIWCGAISGNMKVSFQAARSIG